MMSPTDEQLVARHMKGDAGSLELLLRRYLPLLYGFARRYSGDPDTAADIAQEAAVKAWRNLAKFDQSQSFRNWIYTIAKNTALDWLKRKDAIPFSGSAEDFESTLADDASLETEIVMRERKRRIDTALGTLPEPYRQVVSLRHSRDLAFKEISRVLGEPLNTVKSRYRRALALAREALRGRSVF